MAQWARLGARRLAHQHAAVRRSSWRSINATFVGVHWPVGFNGCLVHSFTVHTLFVAVISEKVFWRRLKIDQFLQRMNSADHKGEYEDLSVGVEASWVSYSLSKGQSCSCDRRCPSIVILRSSPVCCSRLWSAGRILSVRGESVTEHWARCHAFSVAVTSNNRPLF